MTLAALLRLMASPHDAGCVLGDPLEVEIALDARPVLLAAYRDANWQRAEQEGMRHEV